MSRSTADICTCASRCNHHRCLYTFKPGGSLHACACVAVSIHSCNTTVCQPWISCSVLNTVELRVGPCAAFTATAEELFISIVFGSLLITSPVATCQTHMSTYCMCERHKRRLWSVNALLLTPGTVATITGSVRVNVNNRPWGFYFFIIWIYQTYPSKQKLANFEQKKNPTSFA